MTSSCPSLLTSLFAGAFLWAPLPQEPEGKTLWVAEAGLEEVGLGLKEDAEIFLEEACLWLNLPRPTQCRIHLVARREDLAKALGGEAPTWAAAVTRVGADEIWLATEVAGGINRLRVTLRHEVVHLVMGALGEGAHRRLPAWFREGCAEQFAGDVYLGGLGVSLPWRSFTGGLSPLSDFRDGFGREADHAAEGYALGYAMVERLVRLYGEDIVAKILSRVAEGYTLDRALLALTGLSVVTHEQALRSDLASIPSLAGEAGPGFLTFIFLILALCSPLLFWLRAKKRKRFEEAWAAEISPEREKESEVAEEELGDALDAWIQREEDEGR